MPCLPLRRRCSRSVSAVSRCAARGSRRRVRPTPSRCPPRRPARPMATGAITAGRCRDGATRRSLTSRRRMSAGFNSLGPSAPATCRSRPRRSSTSGSIIRRRRRSISATRSTPARRIPSCRRSMPRPARRSGAGTKTRRSRATTIWYAGASPISRRRRERRARVASSLPRSMPVSSPSTPIRAVRAKPSPTVARSICAPTWARRSPRTKSAPRHPSSSTTG